MSEIEQKTVVEADLPYKVKDVALATAGRKAIEMAEKEMPGLMAVRKKYGTEKHKIPEKLFRLKILVQ